MMRKTGYILIASVLMAGLASAQIWSEGFDPAPVLNVDGFGEITNEWSTGQWIHTKASIQSDVVVEGVTNLVLQLKSDGGSNVGDTEGAGISLDGGLFSSAGTYAVEVAVLSDSNSVGALGVSIYDADIGSGGTNSYRLDTKKNLKNAWLDVSAVGDASATLLTQAKLVAGTTNQVVFSYDGSGDVVLMLGAMQRWVDVQSLLKIDDISVDVAIANNAPVFSADSITNLAAGAEGAVYSDTIAGAATDIDPDTLSYYKVFGPDWLVVASDGSLSGTPPNGADGLNQFEIWVTDGKGGYDGVDLEITVTDALNDAPVFTSDPVIKKSVGRDAAYDESIAGDASDSQDDTMFFSKVSFAGPGSDWLAIATGGALSGAPAAANVGTNSWEVEVSDGSLASTGTIVIVVTALTPPILDETFDTSVGLVIDNNAQFTNEVSWGQWVGTGDAVENVGRLKVVGTDGKTRGVFISLNESEFADEVADYRLTLHWSMTLSADSYLKTQIFEADIGSGGVDNYYAIDSFAGSGTGPSMSTTGDAFKNQITNTVSVAGIVDSQEQVIDFSTDGTHDIAMVFAHMSTSATKGVLYLEGVRLERIVEMSAYEIWAADNNLIYGPEGDDDEDDLSNLYEYGLGLDPTNTTDPRAVADGALPTFGMGSGGMEYIHAQRTDDDSLTYYLELDGDLVAAPGWTNVGYTVTGTNVTGATFDYVTNAIPTTDAQKFIRLIVEQQ